MSFREWLASLFGHRKPAPDPARQRLDSHQQQIAERLGRMRGSTREDVLAEAYRRADRELAKGRR